MKEFLSCQEAMKSCIEHTYFSIAHLYKEEKAMNMHIHDCYELYYSISGGKQFLIDNRFYSIKPGDLFVINQYESHYLTQIDQEVHERIVLSVHPEFVKQLSSSETNLANCFSRKSDCGGNHKLSLSKEEQSRFLYYVNKITSCDGYGSDLIERAGFVELMVFLNIVYEKAACVGVGAPTALETSGAVRASGTLETSTAVGMPAALETSTAVGAPTAVNSSYYNPIMSSYRYYSQVQDILAHINQNITSRITISDLSTQFYLSESYICRIFKATTGTTINKYISARRISIAKSLLADGYSVNDTCEKCGYQDYSNFVKSFTKSVGISPKKYGKCEIGRASCRERVYVLV